MVPRVRWLVLALLFAFAFTGYVQRTGVAIAAERMMQELGLTQVQVGWLFTAFLFTYSVFQLPGALVGQWAGARRAPLAWRSVRGQSPRRRKETYRA